MSGTVLRAHYDGAQILLDEPATLSPNARLLITVLPEEDKEREDWFRFAATNLGRAYDDDEPEYPLSSLIEVNPDYEGS